MLKINDECKKFNALIERAKRDMKGNHMIYNMYRRELEDLDLSPKEYEHAVIMLSKVLKI